MTKINNNIIDLSDFRAEKSKVFTGRPYGKEVRENSNIDNIEAESNEVIVIIPDNIYSIGPSFFEELFINSIKKLGKEKFLEKFKFTNKGKYNFETPLNEAIERVLRKKTALD
jgi:STAS-like domain of unknown function (DUF4325)